MSPNLPVGGSALDLQLGTRGALPSDVTQLALTLTYARFADELAGSEPVEGDSPLLEATLTQLTLRHHFGHGWSADFSLPAGSISIEPASGEPTRRLSGFGDVEIGGAYDFAALWGTGGYRPSLTLRLGLGLPTGRHDTLGEEGGAPDSVPPNVLSIGYGAYGGAAELRLTQFANPWLGVSPSVSLRRPLGANESGVTMGTSTAIGFDALVLPARDLLVIAGSSLQTRTHSREQEEGTILNSGGRAVFASLSATLRASGALSLGLGGRMPLYTHVNGRQVVESYSVLATLSVTFGADADEHDDEHEHADEPHEHGDEHEHDDAGPRSDERPGKAGQPAVPDVRDAAVGGESFELSRTLVPGKITVVDFWATWCHACIHVEAALRKLAREHAELAVRRVEVPDFDTEVASRHLAGEQTLPLVWIFDARGARRRVVRAADEVAPAVLQLLREQEADTTSTRAPARAD